MFTFAAQKGKNGYQGAAKENNGSRGSQCDQVDRIYEFGIAAYSAVPGVICAAGDWGSELWADAAGADHNCFAWGDISVDIHTDVDKYE